MSKSYVRFLEYAVACHRCGDKMEAGTDVITKKVVRKILNFCSFGCLSRYAKERVAQIIRGQ